MNIRSPKTANSDLIATEASTWFIEFRAGDMTAADRARFYEWLRRSPEHIQAYLEIAEGWAELPTADPEQQLNIQALIARARESQDDNVVPLSPREPTLPIRRRPAMTAWAASLAGVALVLGAAVWTYLYQATTYRTGVGEQRMVRLLDGSIVELNALSSIRVRLSNTAREVDLKGGQAFFRVAKDPARPFLVHSDGTTVRAVGTQFDVYRKGTGTTVTVLEGRVAVAETSNTTEALAQPGVGSQRPLLLVAGEQITVPTEHTVKQQPRRADVAVATAWVQKRLIFQETPLAEVAEEFNRYNSRRLVIVDPQLRSVGISGVYSSTDPDSLLGFLRAQPNIELSETDREIRVTLREKK
jgi:transmembrane sensor